MIAILRDAVAAVMIAGGSAFCLIGAVGLLRFPNFNSRLHAASLVDSFGAVLILVGFAVIAPSPIIAAKIILVAVISLVASPTAAHAIAHSSHLYPPTPTQKP